MACSQEGTARLKCVPLGDVIRVDWVLVRLWRCAADEKSGTFELAMNILRRMRGLRFVLLSLVSIQGTAVAGTVLGTAFGIGDGRTYVTNYHVVEESALLCLRDSVGRLHRAQVIASDKADDLAILRSNLIVDALPLAPAGELQRGISVLTIGYPNPSILGFESKVTDGIVNSLSGIQGDQRRVQISVPIQPGNSGGPLISSKGNVVGVVVSKLGTKYMQATGDLPQNVGYAVNVARLRALIETTPRLQPLLRIPNATTRTDRVALVRDTEESVVLLVGFGKGRDACNAGGDGEIPAFDRQPINPRPLGERARREALAAEREALERAHVAERERERQEAIRQETLRRAAERLEQERVEAARRDAERHAAERRELERVERERQENEIREAHRRDAVRKAEESRRRAFEAALAVAEPHWEVVLSGPGFKAWQTTAAPLSAEFLVTHSDPSAALDLLRRYRSYVQEVRGLGSDAITAEDLRFGALIQIGLVESVDVKNGYMVARFPRGMAGYVNDVWLPNPLTGGWLTLRKERSYGDYASFVSGEVTKELQKGSRLWVYQDMGPKGGK